MNSKLTNKTLLVTCPAFPEVTKQDYRQIADPTFETYGLRPMQNMTR
jgi:hypothetical protein